VPLPAGAHDVGHILTDAIGAGSGPPTVDIERIGLHNGDVVLLCTDGLNAAVDDSSIADLLVHPRSLDDQCVQLVDLAFSRGADDDVTVILARYQIPASAP
jgi:protein phosphatase